MKKPIEYISEKELCEVTDKTESIIWHSDCKKICNKLNAIIRRNIRKREKHEVEK